MRASAGRTIGIGSRRLPRAETPACDAGTLLAGFVQAASVSLERLREGIDADALDRAVGLLSAAQTIYLLGSRRSFPLTTFLAYAMRKLAMRCELVDQIGGLAPEQVALIQPTDVLLAVSFTPYSPVTLELSAAAGRAGVPVVAITDTPFSPLVQPATVWLEVAEADHAGFRSLAGSFVLGMAVAVAAAGRRGSSPDS